MEGAPCALRCSDGQRRRVTADCHTTLKLGDLRMWLQLMWLQFEVVRGPVGGHLESIWGRLGAPRTQTTENALRDANIDNWPGKTLMVQKTLIIMIGGSKNKPYLPTNGCLPLAPGASSRCSVTFVSFLGGGPGADRKTSMFGAQDGPSRPERPNSTISGRTPDP